MIIILNWHDSFTTSSSCNFHLKVAIFFGREKKKKGLKFSDKSITTHLVWGQIRRAASVMDHIAWFTPVDSPCTFIRIKIFESESFFRSVGSMKEYIISSHLTSKISSYSRDDTSTFRLKFYWNCLHRTITNLSRRVKSIDLISSGRALNYIDFAYFWYIL